MSQLNKQQHAAALPHPGINLIIAGAGTGKTKTLVEKVKNIITQTEHRAENILILTFSRKAALEIKERVAHGIGKEAEAISSGTFHSFCLRFLKEHEDIFLQTCGFNKFPSILIDDEKEKLVKDIITPRLDAFLGMPIDIIMYLVENYENLPKAYYNKLVRSELIKELKYIQLQIKKTKQAHNLVEFEDLIDCTILLLKNNSQLRQKIREQYTYIFVDEFQDTSHNNFELLQQLLPDNNPNLFIVGDDWQSIYGFRNAYVGYIINLGKFLPGVTIHKLTTNYRSHHEIVRLSNSFIKKNKFRTRKKLSSFKGRGGSICSLLVNSFTQETATIIRIIEHESLTAKNITVLFRNNWQGEYIQNRLPDSQKNNDKLCFMTMHASKGLEFEVVIIIGISDDIIPDRDTDIEEERRLLYVAITRAEKKLFLIAHADENGEPPLFARELGVRFSKKY